MMCLGGSYMKVPAHITTSLSCASISPRLITLNASIESAQSISEENGVVYVHNMFADVFHDAPSYSVFYRNRAACQVKVDEHDAWLQKLANEKADQEAANKVKMDKFR